MQYELEKSFIRDCKNLQDETRLALADVLLSIQAVESLEQIPNIKKMKGYKPNNAYRIRVGNFRLGIYIENEIVIISRFLPRKDIYSKFP